MKYTVIVLSFLFVAAIAFTSGLIIGKTGTHPISRLVTIEPTPRPTPLAQYTIENLQQTQIQPGKLTLSEPEDNDSEDFTTHTFSFEFKPAPAQDHTKTSTGQVNFPVEAAKYPIVIMLRGFVPEDSYVTGVGTRNAARYFASNGAITIAPDFLGYAGGSEEAGDIFETRFQTYTTVLSLIETLRQNGLPNWDVSRGASAEWDGQNIFIWAHSNGGQIALTTLAVTGETLPTTLWAPVTKPFPYSVLYYTDESADGGKLIRTELAEFEQLYDVDNFSFTNYLSNIKAPLQFHQGTADDAVPVNWTQSFFQMLKTLEVEVEYKNHAGADHNMSPAWDEAVEQDLDFFTRHTK